MMYTMGILLTLVGCILMILGVASSDKELSLYSVGMVLGGQMIVYLS